jgi:phage terminase large subunit
MRAQFPAKLKGLFQPARYKVIRGGRGSAKSWSVARALIIKMRQRKLRWLCAREIQKSIKDSVYALIADQIAALGQSADWELVETEIRCKVTGSVFLFTGLQSHTVDSIKSFEGCDGCWVEEAHSVTGRSWDVLIPTIRKAGSEIWITFNPQLESDETYNRFVTNAEPSWLSVEMNWRDNPWFPAVLSDERELAQRSMKPAKYRHIWEGKCMPAVDGAIYFDEVAQAEEGGRITRVPHDRLLKTHAIWDLGWNDAMSIILVQRSTSELRVIDYIEDSHKKLSDYVEMLKAKPYTWGQDWLPHDGFSKDFKTGKSAEEMLRALGRSVARTPNTDVESGIKAAREVFDRIYFDAEKSARLIECLKRYRRNIGAKTGEAGAPLHDEFSHGADAFRYLALCADQLKNTDRKPHKHSEINHSASWMAS